MIGIFGGTFDPIHNGHVHIAQQVLERVTLKRVDFLPCSIPVHRGVPHESALHRVRMIEIAIAHEPKFNLNTLELDRDGKSYMVDSLRETRESRPDQTSCLILGSDAFNQLPQWKSPQEILQLSHLIVCCRPNVSPDDSIFSEHWVRSINALDETTEGYILPLEIDENPCSSTQVRDGLESRAADINCLHPEVFQYIQDLQLYH